MRAFRNHALLVGLTAVDCTAVLLSDFHALQQLTLLDNSTVILYLRSADLSIFYQHKKLMTLNLSYPLNEPWQNPALKTT